MSPEVHRFDLDREPVTGASPGAGVGSRPEHQENHERHEDHEDHGRQDGQDGQDGQDRHDSIVNDDTAALIDDGASGIVGAEASLEAVRRERDEYLDMVRRVQADFENYKKRMQRQQSDQLERATENLVAKLLPALDALDLARAHLSAEENASGGVKALLQATALLTDALAKDGLERIDDPGVPFDPTVHDAVEHAPAENDAESGVVAGVLRAGYRWKGRVIRPAMVRVSG